ASPEPGDTDAPANPDEPAETPGDDAPADDNHNRVAVIELVNAEPETTRETLEALGVREVVSSFSTGLTADSIRTGNLRRGSELITGTLVRPGEEFSLLRALGPITAANGFGNAPIIQGGQLVPGVGGGLSQLATNMYNVGFFAGFEDIEHRPHSQFIPRYPAGREATIVAGSLDMRWRNNTPYGAVVQSWVAGGQLHSRVWSTPYFTVETSASGRSNVRPATTIQGSGGNCVPSSPGQAGFTITNHRRVLRQGQVIINESNTWSYSPANGVSCPSPEPPQHEAGGDE
ncbi:MAG: VanW family protein, partial [Cellulomonadaceae bacterium]|nr:VanW family protein [Cellulomonadaceae bacterium]